MLNNSYKLFFQTIANENRITILALIHQKRKSSVMQIVKELRLEQSIVSHNLKCLTRCGFLNRKRVGKNIFYSLNGDTVTKLLKLADQHLDKNCEHLNHCSILKNEQSSKVI